MPVLEYRRLGAVLPFSSDHASEKSADKIMQIRKASTFTAFPSLSQVAASSFALQKLGKERDCSQSKNIDNGFRTCFTILPLLSMHNYSAARVKFEPETISNH